MKGDHIYTCDCDPLTLAHGRRQTLFQGRAKFSSRWQKHTIFFEKSKNILFWPAKGGGGGGPRVPSCPPLRTPMPWLLILILCLILIVLKVVNVQLKFSLRAQNLCQTG